MTTVTMIDKQVVFLTLQLFFPGSIINTDVPDNITIASPVFTSTQPDICITFENTVQTDYNLTAAVYNLSGTIINSTYMYSMDDNSFLALDVKTVPGNDYIFFIEGPEPWGYYNSYLNISIDSVRFYSQKCSDVGKLFLNHRLNLTL